MLEEFALEKIFETIMSPTREKREIFEFSRNLIGTIDYLRNNVSSIEFWTKTLEDYLDRDSRKEIFNKDLTFISSKNQLLGLKISNLKYLTLNSKLGISDFVKYSCSLLLSLNVYCEHIYGERFIIKENVKRFTIEENNEDLDLINERALLLTNNKKLKHFLLNLLTIFLIIYIFTGFFANLKALFF